MLYQMSYFRLLFKSDQFPEQTQTFRVGREGFEPSKLSQRIYSPSHLATLVSPLLNGPKTSTDKELEPMEGFEPPTH